MKQTIVFAGGGTLGHVTPALSVAKYLTDRNYQACYIASIKGLEKNVLDHERYLTKVYYIDVEGLKRKVTITNIKALVKFLKAIKTIKKIFKKITPSVVVGMGGYVSAAAIYAARLLKIPTIAHEQNSTLGLVNKLIIKKVDCMLLSYPIKNYNNTLFIGNPRMSDFYEKRSNSISKEYDILVLSGSLGSLKINNFFIDNQYILSKANYKIMLVTGKKYYEEVKEKIVTDNILVVPFIDDVSTELAKTRLLIARSGATTVAEVIGLGVVTIFIPSINVTNNHQYYNAAYYESLGCCSLIPEEDVDEKLIHEIKSMLSDNWKRESIINNLKHPELVDAKYKFAEKIIELVGDETNV